MEAALEVVDPRSSMVPSPRAQPSVVRLPRRIMKKLGLEPGDHVEVIGKRSVYAQAWPAYMADEYIGDIIGMDASLRRVAGVEVGDVIRVRKAQLGPARRVVLAPMEDRVVVDTEYVKKEILFYRPVNRGQVIDIPFYGGAIRFVVVEVQPEPAAYVTADTEVSVWKEPLSEVVKSFILERMVALNCHKIIRDVLERFSELGIDNETISKQIMEMTLDKTLEHLIGQLQAKRS